VRRWLSVRPVSGRDPEPGDPMHVEAALRAVGDEVLKFALEIGLHVQELEPEHLGVHDKRVGSTVPDFDRLVDEGVGLRGLLGDGVNGMLEDLTLRQVMRERLVLLSDDALALRLFGGAANNWASLHRTSKVATTLAITATMNETIQSLNLRKRLTCPDVSSSNDGKAQVTTTPIIAGGRSATRIAHKGQSSSPARSTGKSKSFGMMTRAATK
jgi:hypothetical protein